jgi:hypothetical protein
MVKRIAVCALVLGLGLLAGWWLRGELAVDACLDSGGKSLPGAGHCIGSKYGETDY